ncbi:MAG: BlaI/MecI/CopY family transcriptional regulator [Gammaproteobacteria bacterium]|nr:BlaI/MecI/CopY family transcriptional regulator [Gammaproteobacteria bacterium]
MRNVTKTPPRSLGELEQMVMDYLWSQGSSTAEQCREALLARHVMKDSTVRTVLRRLERKGFVRHEVDGRTFIYRPTQARPNVAARGVRHIIDRFCGGSVEQLLVGMVENDVLDHAELERLAHKIAHMKKRTP